MIGTPGVPVTADESYDLDNDMLFGNNVFELKEREVRTVERTLEQDN
jgi:hypothetical protein